MSAVKMADRLVNELMLVSVLVAGEGAETMASLLTQAGVAAETIGEPEPQAGFDLSILLAASDDADAPGMADLVAALSRTSERVLFAPLPLREDEDDALPGLAPGLDELTRWFEIFAELGYQPVVDFDAGFVSAGAFLVDRAATAAESELAAFADRLQNAAPPPGRDAVPQADLAELASLRAALTARDAQLAALTAELAQTAASLRQTEAVNAGWDGLRAWAQAAISDPSRDTEAALQRDMPRIQALRGNDAPALLLAAPVLPKRRGWLARLFGNAPLPLPVPKNSILEDCTLVRASRFFDAAWYIASTPELAAGETIDPVFHYVLVGSLNGADPGPWFDTQAYFGARAGLRETGVCALVHAIRSGETDKLSQP